MGVFERLKNAFNAFRGEDYTRHVSHGTTMPPIRRSQTYGNRSMLNSIINKIAIDAAEVDIRHVRLDEEERYIETIDSSLNQCLRVEANTDQSGRAFRQDVFQSMLEEGVVAIVPSFTDRNMLTNEQFNILALRTAKILEWYPDSVRVKFFNEDTGKQQERVLPKRCVAIVENPFYSVMNETSSTFQRLVHKLNLLDRIDDETGSGKLDLIIQLPYPIRGEKRKADADERRKNIADQLANSKYGVAYIDSTEHVTQMNRPIENNLQSQIEYLTTQLYNQLGITPEIQNGTANDVAMLNYQSRVIETLVSAVTDELYRKFLSKTARSQKQSIMAFNQPFKLVPLDKIAQVSDVLARNEILTSNEIRQMLGYKPSSDPKADMLVNSNMPQQEQMAQEPAVDDTGQPIDEQDQPMEEAPQEEVAQEPQQQQRVTPEEVKQMLFGHNT